MKIFIQSKFFRIVLPFLVLTLGAWLSSGTLNIYAITHNRPFFDDDAFMKECGYLFNLDHAQFIAAFKLIDGQPRETWAWAILLRRILFPLFSYPFMKAFGLVSGGFIASLLVQWLGFFSLYRYFKSKFSVTHAELAVWFYALYPGLFYWVGSPYCYATIVPLSVMGLICLEKISESGLKKSILLTALLGLFFASYDLLPFFVPALVWVLFRTKRMSQIPFFLLVVLLPYALSNVILRHGFGIAYVNDNSGVYGNVLRSYFPPYTDKEWIPHVIAFPRIFIHLFFSSNFYFLPFLFLVAFLSSVFFTSTESKEKLTHPEAGILLAGLGLFTFNNLAPTYPAWQMRGEWLARIYQPVFCVYLFFSVRVFRRILFSKIEKLKTLLSTVLLLGLFLNAVVIFGPATWPGLADFVYFDFYHHSPEGTLTLNLEKHGKKPLGVCKK